MLLLKWSPDSGAILLLVPHGGAKMMRAPAVAEYKMKVKLLVAATLAPVATRESFCPAEDVFFFHVSICFLWKRDADKAVRKVII